MRKASRIGVGWVLVVVVGSGVAAAQEGADATVTARAAKAKVGQPAQVTVRFAVPAGSHISPDAPLSLRFSGDAHVQIARPVLHYRDGSLDQGGPEFRDQVTPLTAGAHDVTVDASYYVCTAQLCNRHTKTLHLTVTAK